MEITKIDKNFAAQEVDENGCLYRDVKEKPFSLEGLAWYEENEKAYRRLPVRFTENEINSGAISLSPHTSGVCVRFRSDSKQIMIRATLFASCDMNHMPRAGSCGFDSYCRPLNGEWTYNTTVQPGRTETGVVTKINAIAGRNPEGRLCDWIINFPLYGGVEQVELGLQENSILLEPTPYKVKDPILFYGSSITQGGCASRPGNQYSSMLCRKVNAPQINLGFSGSGMGEIALAQEIAKLKLSAFVMDYDHNAPNTEHLQKTHEAFFQAIRSVQKDLPIVMMSRCDYKPTAENDLRREIVRTTYMNAVRNGDKHVYYIDGEILFGKNMRDACTVDGCHPNDLGFFRMYKHVLPVLKKALKEGKGKE